MMHVISVYNKPEFPETKGAGILRQAQEFFGISTIEDIKCVKKYYLEGASEEDAKKAAEGLFCEDVWQDYTLNSSFFKDTAHHAEIAYKPGMMNPEIQSIMTALKAMGISSVKAADSSHEYFFYGKSVDPSEVNTIVQNFIMNPLIEDVRVDVPETLIMTGEVAPTKTIAVTQATDEELMELSKDTLFLNLEEMKVIQNYFKELGREPTDGELETLAQTWSEHCNHKTFRAKLIVDGKEKAPLYERLKQSTKDINHPMVVSAFKDNSGVFEFYNGYAVCGKVETHNSPSALDPYGGAMTGSGGVFRDILGTGQGSKVIASTDIFCLGMPDSDFSEVPKGCKHPRYIFKRVIEGVRDYGNRMGIPTNNGSLHFHPDFRAKPTVIVGAYGLLPKDKAQKGTPEPGDKIVTLGGRTGRDGIHGATFSSAEMTDRTESINSSAVQIGNAIEEHRVIHAVLEARDKGYIRALTDCGAGGFSSAIGEMGEPVGAKVQLEKVPLKYVGLAPWEIWISESQERMVLCIPPEHIEDAQKVFDQYNVEASIVGEFTGDKKLQVSYNDEVVCDLDMEFLHDGLPQRVMKAEAKQKTFDEPSISPKEDLSDDLMAVMKHWNICSREAIIRQYDHNVQGSAVQMPLSGKTHSAPNDASVIEPLLGTGHGLAISNGLNPILNRIDPYYGSQWAIMEAVSNVVAVGADPEKIALIDNFIWPVPDEEYLWSLDRSIDACTDTARAFGMPFISGKDSLSSTYKTDDMVIHIPPALCISCFAPIDDINKTVSAHFKQEGNAIYVIGETTNELGGSVYYDLYNGVGNNVPKADVNKVLEIYKKMHQVITKSLVVSSHDISEGGIGAALTEMTFGSFTGIKVDIADCPVTEGSYTVADILFSETPGRFVVEVSPEKEQEFQEIMRGVSFARIGEVTRSGNVVITNQNKVIAQGASEDFFNQWKAPIDGIFA